VIDRRQFVRFSSAWGTTILLAGCHRPATPPTAPPADHAPSTDSSPPPPSPPQATSIPPVKKLSAESFLAFLDRRAEINMARCHHCAQASFLTLREGFGLPNGGILKALTPLPGIAERGETCGAVIGSLMAIGLVFGREQLGDAATWRASLQPAQAFCSRFEAEFGSTQCGDLLERLFGRRYDLGDPYEQAEFIAASPGPTEICGRVVRTAVRFAAEEILRHDSSLL
jgi:C_GCAxxG_C_C family probable redox protein